MSARRPPAWKNAPPESWRPHLQTAARHFRNGEIARGCAHVFAAQGHPRLAENVLAELAVLHTERSVP